MNERDSTSLSNAGTHPINGRCNDEGHVGDVAMLNSKGIDTSDEGHQRYYYQVGMDQNHSEEVDARLQQGGSNSCAATMTTASFRGEESECDLSDDVDGLEFIVLPPTIADRAEREIIDDSRINGFKNSIFNGRFWWQQIASIPISSDDACLDTFECILNCFGFERNFSQGKDGANYSLRYIIPTRSSKSPPLRPDRIENILHLSRLIDLSRILVHMGRDSLALLAMSDYCQSRSHDSFNALIEGASRSIKSLLDSRSSSSIFEVQVNLLVISETLHLYYDESLRGDGAVLGGQLQCIDKLIDQMRFSSSIDDRVETAPIPAGFETLLESVHRSIPSSNHGYIEEHDEWNSFTSALRSMMEKLVMNLTHIGLNEQLAALYQSTCLGKLLSRLISIASRKHSFVPYLHIIEPIWSSLQPLRQSMSGCKRWLHSDLIGIVFIGPVIFECVAEVIAPPRAGTKSKKSTMALDTRAFASVTSLDKCVVGILKELNRGVGTNDNERGLLEVLLAPLHSLSASICITLRSFEKAHDRLGRLLSDEISSYDKKRPTVYALSEMVWSQLVQIRMLCPHSSVPLKNVVRTTGALNEPSMLPHDILIFHREIASKIVGYGIWLWGITLRGNTHMNIISPCFNRKCCIEWERLRAQIFTVDHPQKVCDGRFAIDACEHSTAVEFNLSNPYSELIGARGDSISVFPESIFLLGKRLVSLNLENCALASLPVSIGYQLANLRVSVL